LGRFISVLTVLPGRLSSSMHFVPSHPISVRPIQILLFHPIVALKRAVFMPTIPFGLDQALSPSHGFEYVPLPCLYNSAEILHTSVLKMEAEYAPKMSIYTCMLSQPRGSLSERSLPREPQNMFSLHLGLPNRLLP
jgi:hypothetical protein